MKATERYATISERGLQWDSVPMRLFPKAKRLGTWDPQAIDFSRDGADWAGFTAVEKDFILRTVALFQAGEEGVTSDLLSLIMVVASEGRIEEEIVLTSFLWEKAKHVEFFRRWLDEVVGAHEDLGHYLTPSYRQLFLEELPKSRNALKTDHSTAAQIRASVTYNMTSRVSSRKPATTDSKSLSKATGCSRACSTASDWCHVTRAGTFDTGCSF